MNTLPDTLRIPLQDALSIKRPSGSLTEAAFVARIVARFPQHLQAIDEAGNVHFKVGESRTLFAAHADTVHSEEGVNKYTQEGSTVKASGAPLGADDGAGIAILCHMMSHSVPGYYIISRSEEVGGIGAKYIVDNFPYLLEQFDRSICFDRAGTSEIITVQGGERLASKEFAEALSEELAQQGLLYEESTKGVFTDNALWGDLIAENVNLGVAYAKQHGPNEYLALQPFLELAEAAVCIDWGSLPTVRKPGKEESKPYGNLSTYIYDEIREIEVDDAVGDWMNDNPKALRELLTRELADLTNCTFAECEKHIQMHKLPKDFLDETRLWGDELLWELLTIVAPDTV